MFLPERWRLWLFEQLSEDFNVFDLEQHQIDRLNKRMSEAIKVLERVAKYLKLSNEQALATLTMALFNSVPERTREGWSAHRVADALHGSWELAKGVAFSGVILPVTAERHWEKKKGLARKRRETAFTLVTVQEWLETKPGKKTRRACTQWVKAQNKERKPGEKPLLEAETISRRWRLPWPEIVQAVEECRVPGEPEPSDELVVENKKATTAEGSSKSASGPSTRRYVLDPDLRARRIKAARQAHQWSLAELANRSGLDTSHVAKVERAATRNPSFETIAKLAEALGLTLDDFVSDG